MSVEVNEENYKKFSIEYIMLLNALHTIKRDTSLFSTHKPIYEHRYFTQLVDMGDRIINFLFSTGTQKGFNWVIFILLHEITKEDPVPEECTGSFDHQIYYWLEWYLRSNYRKNNDVYLGLVK